MTVLEVEDIKKIYRPRFGGNQVQALSKVTFSVEEGEYVSIMGESGSGKTTLLNIMAALDRPTQGEVYLDGRPLSAIKEKDISKFRRENLGFVFQDFSLLDTYPASVGAERRTVPGNESETDAGCRRTGNCRSSGKISL